MSLEDAWNNTFERLKDFTKQHGHARPAQRDEFDGLKLGQWAGVQRRSHNKGKLSSERIKRLESLNGWEWKGKPGD